MAELIIVHWRMQMEMAILFSPLNVSLWRLDYHTCAPCRFGIADCGWQDDFLVLMYLLVDQSGYLAEESKKKRRRRR